MVHNLLFIIPNGLRPPRAKRTCPVVDAWSLSARGEKVSAVRERIGSAAGEASARSVSCLVLSRARCKPREDEVAARRAEVSPSEAPEEARAPTNRIESRAEPPRILRAVASPFSSPAQAFRRASFLYPFAAGVSEPEPRLWPKPGRTNVYVSLAFPGEVRGHVEARP